MFLNKSHYYYYYIINFINFIIIVTIVLGWLYFKVEINSLSRFKVKKTQEKLKELYFMFIKSITSTNALTPSKFLESWFVTGWAYIIRNSISPISIPVIHI